MQALEELQRTFYDAVFSKEPALDFVSSKYPSERFDTYRRTIFENMRNALSITFSGTWKLLGEECANSVAYAFCKIKNNQPFSGCLDDWGADFPKFLSAQEPLKTLPYLKDYATYEWLKHQAYCAKNVKAMSSASFATIPEEEIDDTCFVFIPSFAVFTSDFPIMDIHEIATNPDAKSIDLKSCKSYAVIARPEDEVLTLWISEDLWHFCDAMYNGMTLGDAYEKLEAEYPNFDLAGAIHFVVTMKLIYKILIIGGMNEE